MSALDALLDQLADAVARRVIELQKAEAEKSRTVYLTPAQMAARLKLAPKTLANMRSGGTGPKFTKAGGRVRYPITDGHG